tara:strand:- start:1682 stop:2296 length:615 start_codon:yes stop_codon:yes gene_type:complete
MNPERLRAMVIWGGACVIFCLLVYLGSNQIVSKFDHHYDVYFEFEKDIPLIPWMIYFYTSFHLLLILNFFIIKKPLVIKAFTLSLMFSSLIASIVFLSFPGELGFSRTDNISGYEFIYNLLHEIDHPHNLYPSLHITFSVLTVFAMIDQTKQKWFHLFLTVWILLICASVVLVHQHHLFDVFTGLILAYVAIKLVYRRYVVSVF